MKRKQDCICDSCAPEKKGNGATRREFLCIAAGTAAALGTPSAAWSFTAPDPLRVERARKLTSASVQIKKQSVRNSGTQSQNPAVVMLPKFPNMHTHLRQGKSLPFFVARELEMGSDIIVAMPNTNPPVSRVTGPAADKSWSIESYLGMIRRAGGGKFRDVIVPLYLTANATPKMIDEGAKSGLLRAIKYYHPPGNDTNAEFGLPIEKWIGSDTFKALEANGIVACFHGESGTVTPETFFDSADNAEASFYRESMPRIIDRHPRLRISCEHLTTGAAVNFVKECGDNVVGTVTPQHLLYTIGYFLQKDRADLYCMPLVKFEADRAALWAAVTDSDNRKFIAGTDSAPHPRIEKSTPCGCAAGCFTGGIAPQLYAQAFEQAGLDLAESSAQDIFRRFMAENAWRFWGFEPSKETIRLIRKPSEITVLTLPDGQQIEPLPLGMAESCGAPSISIPWSFEV